MEKLQIRIHDGLNNEEIREFISKSLMENQIKSHKNVKLIIPREKGIDWIINDLKEDIKQKEKQLELLEELKAIIKIMTINYWEEFDTSDIIERFPGEPFCRKFIGNQTEYEKFKEKIMLNQ